MSIPARDASDDALVSELVRRRDVAIENARHVVGRAGIDDGTSLFSNLYAARQCDEALQLLARLDCTPVAR